MTVPMRHILHQGPVIASLGITALASLRHQAKHVPVPSCPGPWFEENLPPRADDLVRDYVRHVGGDPSWYHGTVPAHFFPQWGVPLAARTLRDLPYPLARVINAGCRLEVIHPLPAGEGLRVRARLESIDDNGSRAILTQRIVTGTSRVPEAIVADMKVFVPLAKKRDGTKGSKPSFALPTDAKEIGHMALPANAGLDFAMLTGDFNPIHWLSPYARLSGFRSCILHGFGTFARAIECLNRSLWDGDAARLSVVEAKFAKPLVLPGTATVYASPDGGLFVGEVSSGSYYLEGKFTAGQPRGVP